jgi:hypothetical protein
MSRALPIELWQLILEDLEGTEVDFFDMFTTAQKNKVTQKLSKSNSGS